MTMHHKEKECFVLLPYVRNRYGRTQFSTIRIVKFILASTPPLDILAKMDTNVFIRIRNIHHNSGSKPE